MSEGWNVVREVMRTWVDRSLSGFSKTIAGNHVSARAQEVISSEASAKDARGDLEREGKRQERGMKLQELHWHP